MFLVIILSQFLHLQQTTYINAIDKQYPFKIDFVLLIRNKQFRNGITASVIDPGQHNILFVQEHSKKPDNILLTIVKYGPQFSPASEIKYSFYAEDLSITGFTIKSALMTSTSYSSMLLGYLTIVNGYGITLKNNFDMSQKFHEIINGNIKNYFWQTGYFIEPDQNYLLSPFVNIIDVRSISVSTIFIWTNSTSSQQIILQLYIDGGSIQTLNFSVLLFQRGIYQSSTSLNYLNYNFIIENVDNINVSPSSIVQTSNNITSTIYYFGTIHSGKLRNSWNYAVNINNDAPIPYLFNSTFIINRNYNNKSDNSIFASIVWNSSVKATVFRLSASSCSNSQYPYLLMSDQRCFDICPQKQYNDSNKRCNNCSVCTDINQCQFCSINSCDNQQYYVVSTMQCNSCQDFHAYCIKCLLGICSVCQPSTLLQLVNGLCQCNITMYFEITTQKCQQCYGIHKCYSCTNINFCLSCQFPFELTNDNTCLSCVSGYLFISSNSSCKQKISSFDFELLLFNNLSNIITAFSVFEGDIDLVTNYYSHQWRINNTVVFPLQTFFQYNNTLKVEFYIQNYFGSHFIELKFNSISNEDFLVSKEKSQYLNIQYDSSIEIFKKFQKVMNSISQHSGIIVPVLSITSILNYLLGILWDFQMVSYYIFLHIQKPPKLQLFLNVTFQLQNIQILPIQIPNPFEKDFKITQNTVYDEYNVDIYFLRAIFKDLIYFAIFTIIYCIMNALLQNWNPENFFLKKIKSRFVDEIYSNISVLCFSYLLVFAFISTASLSNTIFNSDKHLKNYGVSLIGLCIIFALAMVHIITLAIYKENKLWDTQNCYMGFNREKKYSQITFGLFIITKLLVPVCITLFNPIFCLSVIIVCSLINLIFFTNVRTLKYKISIYYRIISQLSFIVYNCTYIAFYVIQTHFSNTINNKVIEALGWLSITLICLVLIMDILGLFTEIILDIIRFIQRLMLNYQIKNLHSSFDQEISKSTNIERSKKSKRKVRNGSKHKTTKILPRPSRFKFIQRSEQTKIVLKRPQNSQSIIITSGVQNEINDSRVSIKKNTQKVKKKSTFIE